MTDLSFRSRLTLRWLTAFGLVLALAHTAVYVGAREFLQRDLDAQLRQLAGTELASAVDEPGLGVHLHEFPADAHGAAEVADKFVQLIDVSGRVLMQSPRLGAAPALLDGEALRRSLTGQPTVVAVVAAGRPGRMTGLVTPGPERYVVAVGLFTESLDSTLSRLARLLMGVWFGGLALTGLVGFSLASRALEPIRRITERAGAIADGHFAARLDPPAVDDEIGRMTQLLNRMLDRLHGALESNRRFAADASHELRGPLTAMRGEVDVTLKRERTPEEYREALSVVRERLSVMHALTDDLMLLVRAQEQRLPPVGEVHVADLLHRVSAHVGHAATASGVTVTVDADTSLVVYGEASLLERVFDNLVRNAIQYNRDHGSVAVRATMRAGAGDWVDGEILIEVTDTGVGIPEAERERVFERFYRLDASRSRRTGGAGLGLAISREIVQLFKGSIRVGATVGHGTTVEVRLPGGVATV
ncbi:MAG: ATP-binding protein [Acidobacteriota bacterium]